MMLNHIINKLLYFYKIRTVKTNNNKTNQLLHAYPEKAVLPRPYDYDHTKECIPFHVCLHEAGHYMMAQRYNLQINSVILRRVLLNDANSVRGSVVSLDDEERETETKPYVSFSLGGCMGEICSFVSEQDFKETGNAIFYHQSSIGDAKRAISKQFKLDDKIKQTHLDEFSHGEERAKSEILSLVRNYCQDDLDYMFFNIAIHDSYARKMYNTWRANDFENTNLDKNLEIDNWRA